MPNARSLRTARFSVVAPCYNEEAGVAEFVRRVKAVCAGLRCTYEIVLVNDGSRDRTLENALAIAAGDPTVRVVNLLRNFGHQAAATAGLDVATGDVVALIDSDLQDPPEVMAEMVARWEEGADVAYGKRRTRKGESRIKLITADVFYRLLRRMTKTNIPTDTGDFRVMDRRIVDALRQMRERHRFIRGMVSWVGGTQVAVPYDRKPRFAGETHYPLRKMISFALDAITSFSVVPLRLVTYLAMFIIVMAVVAGLVVFVVKLRNPEYFIPGFAATVLMIIFFGGVQLLALGVIGEYIGRMYESVKSRPIYLVEGIYQVSDQKISVVRPTAKAPETPTAEALPR
ncbi:MAG TPA: glycosyltransferase family 2 protein [Opitutaceae bacterium]|nr:glycosyltransferase family 2 protein [Opitutaceae bacterium]